MDRSHLLLECVGVAQIEPVIDYLSQRFFDNMLMSVFYLEAMAFVVFTVKVPGKRVINEPWMTFDFLESDTFDRIWLIIKPLRSV